MIPNHARFLEALDEKRKLRVRLFSVADNGLVDRICAPMSYGPGPANQDGLNRYWLWDYAGRIGAHTIGLLPQEIIGLQMLGEAFDPALFASEPSAISASPALPPAVVVSAVPLR